MSFSRPSQVSPTTGSAQYDVPNGSGPTASRMIPSRTTPTECVFVIPIGAGQLAGLADPLEPGQLAVAVEAMAAGVERLGPDVAVVRHDHRHAGPDRPLADDERAVAPDERRVADPDARHVRDRVGRARPAPPDDDPEIACSHRARAVRGGRAGRPGELAYHRAR